MMRYFSYVAEAVDPYVNLATEDYLSKYADENIGILFLWQNENTIVVGRNQNTRKECNVDEFLASGGKIARRRSGGGAVYHDLGNLNFSLIGLKTNMQPLLYKDFLTKLVSGYGLKAEYSGRNDILFGGRKFSGNAVYDDGRIVCQHGTIMLDCNIEKMTYYLTPDKEKLRRHAVQSVSSRVMNLNELLPSITVEGMINQAQLLLDAQPLEARLGAEIDGMIRKYQDEDWIYGGVS